MTSPVWRRSFGLSRPLAFARIVSAMPRSIRSHPRFASCTIHAYVAAVARFIPVSASSRSGRRAVARHRRYTAAARSRSRETSAKRPRLSAAIARFSCSYAGRSHFRSGCAMRVAARTNAIVTGHDPSCCSRDTLASMVHRSATRSNVFRGGPYRVAPKTIVRPYLTRHSLRHTASSRCRRERFARRRRRDHFRWHLVRRSEHRRRILLHETLSRHPFDPPLAGARA